jgi:CO/xanthine dehydrogenase FAD-binding subunit
MKPTDFAYLRPRTVDEALHALSQDPEDSKVLAGGQSLVPVLNFRLAAPERLIDINQVAELSYLRRNDGVLHIGAMTRHATLEKSFLIAGGWPLLREAVRWVAHPAIRNRGTIGGSVAHADPAAELPVALSALDAVVVVRSIRGTRSIPCREFFLSTMTTALEPDELLMEIQVPALPASHGYAFEEHSRRNGDFALAGAAVVLTLDGERRCSGVAISLLGAAPTPLRAMRAEEFIGGERLDSVAIDDTARLAAEDSAPSGDIHGSAAYRQSLIEVVVRRALLAANRRAQEDQA